MEKWLWNVTERGCEVEAHAEGAATEATQKRQGSNRKDDRRGQQSASPAERHGSNGLGRYRQSTVDLRKRTGSRNGAMCRTN